MRCVPLCEPDIVKIFSGELLATTPLDHPYRIGVTGWTENEVRQRFSYALDRWEDLAQRSVDGQTSDKGDEASEFGEST